MEGGEVGDGAGESRRTGWIPCVPILLLRKYQPVMISRLINENLRHGADLRECGTCDVEYVASRLVGFIII